MHHSTEVSEHCSSNDGYIYRAALNLILHVGGESQGQNSLWQRQEYSQVFFEVFCLVLVLLWWICWRQTSCTRLYIECHVQQAVHTLACLRLCFLNFNSEMWLKSLQSLHVRCIQGVKGVSENRWTVGSRTYLRFRKKYRSTLVTHREFLIGVYWPRMTTSWMFPVLLQSDFPGPVQLGLLKCRGSTFTAIIWAGAERWSPHVGDGQDCALRPGKEGGTAHMVDLQGKGGKDLEEAEVQETFGAFQAEGLSFHQMIPELLHNVPL